MHEGAMLLLQVLKQAPRLIIHFATQIHFSFQSNFKVHQIQRALTLSFYEVLQGFIKRIRVSMCKAQRQIYYFMVNLKIDGSKGIRGEGFLKVYLGRLKDNCGKDLQRVNNNCSKSLLCIMLLLRIIIVIVHVGIIIVVVHVGAMKTCVVIVEAQKKRKDKK